MSEKYRYFKVYCDVGLGPGVLYNEFLGDSATRQVEQYQGRWFSSKDTDFHEGLGIALCDRSLSDLEDAEGLIEISAAEFEDAWFEGTATNKVS